MKTFIRETCISLFGKCLVEQSRLLAEGLIPRSLGRNLGTGLALEFKPVITTSLICLSVSLNSFSQLSIDTAGKTYTIDFTDYNGSGFSPNPSPGQIDSRCWAVNGLSDGNLDFDSTRASADFTRGVHTGGVSTGGIYAFNTGNNIIMGVQPISTDFTPGSFTLKLYNNTNDTLHRLFISYDIFSFNDQGRGSSLKFSYSLDNINYISLSSLDFITRDTADSSPFWDMTNKNILLSGINIADSSFFYFMWEGDDVNGSGSRDEYGVDNISVIGNPALLSSGFTASNVCYGELMCFTDASLSVNGNINSWQWDFGDSCIDSIQHPVHFYSIPGTYTVCLKVKNENGDVDTAYLPVTVHALPVAAFSSTVISGCAPLQVLFSDSSCLAEGEISTWSWDFGDTSSGMLNHDTVFNPSHLFENSGTYTTKLIVSSEYGCTDSTSMLITSYPVPVVDFSYSVAGWDVSFSNESIISDGIISSYRWDFGDNDSSNLYDPIHVYAGSGKFTVCLAAVSENGCMDTACKEINLITTDINNSETLSGFQTLTELDFSFYPNPLTGNILTIDLTSDASGATIMLTNTLGQMILSKQILNKDGAQILDLTGVAAGLYSLSIVNGNSRVSKGLVIK